MSRILGLDVGTKYIGLAVSDTTLTLAQGKGKVLRRSDDVAIGRITEVIKELGIEKIVVGLPVNMDGTMGERAKDCRAFAEKLKEKTGLAVELWDERLSTKEAEDVMLAADMTRNKRKKVIDKLAAQLILQGYLDSLENR